MADVSPDVRVRPMTDGDVVAVMELERAVFAGDAWSEAMMRGELAEPTRRYFVVETAVSTGGVGQTGVFGYAGLRVAPPEGDVQTIAVSQERWGNGIGTALLRRLLHTAHELGAVEVFLEVRSDNPRARELYRRFGFAEIGVHPGYYQDADAVVMCRSGAAPAGSGPGEEATP